MGSLRLPPLPTAGALVGVLLASILAPVALAHGVAQLPLAPGGQPASLHTPLGEDPSGVLPDLPWETGGPVRVVSGTPWVPLVVDGRAVDGANAPVRGTIEFWCPGVDGGTSVNDATNTFTVRATCPYRIIDDADLMGSAQIAVDPDEPDSMAFFSLHGAGTPDGPTPRSRDPNPEGLGTLTAMSHTTFTTEDHGRSWYDNPWGNEGFGEHVAGAMDRDGNMYIGALWSKRLGDDQFSYVIKVYKEQDGRFQISSYQASKTFVTRAEGNQVEQANLVYAPAQSIFEVMPAQNATGNATGPADDGDLGNATDPNHVGEANSPDDRVVLVWHERARDWRNSTTGKSSWIDAAWTDTTSRDNWTRLANDQLIGPCMEASNPVSWNGKVYVACTVDDGYHGRSRAEIGDVDVWSIDPISGQTRLEETTGISGGVPKMAARPDGFMALTSTRLVDPDEVKVEVTFGWYGRHWREPNDYGVHLHRLASNTGTNAVPPGTPSPPPASNTMVDARVTAMALTEHLDTLFLVYMERVDVGEVGDPNPSNPFISPDSAIEYKKLVATFTPCTGPDNVYDLQVGVARHPFAEAIVGEETGVFDDLQDGMQAVRVDDGERVYFAYGDHGVIQYGALVTTSSMPVELVPCLNPPPAPFMPTALVPQGLAASSAYTAIVGSTVGLTATAMVGYLIVAKRKTAAALAAKAKK